MSTAWAFLDVFRTPGSVLPGWETFESFRAPSGPMPSWIDSAQLVEDHVSLERADVLRLAAELDVWNDRLAHCGGDPATEDWLAFRPLRTEREEDWSDWLQHLLATARSNRLLIAMLGMVWRNQAVKLRREVTVGERRADLVVRGPGALRAQIEVKVGDHDFAKTDETASLLEAAYPGQWTHILLVPSEDASAARRATGEDLGRIAVRTWEEISATIRASLWLREETVDWCVWARAYCGAIEQRLLGLASTAAHIDSASAGALARRLITARNLAEGIHE